MADLQVKIGADVTELNRGIKSAETSLTGFNNQVRQSSQALSQARPSFVGLGQTLRDAGNFAISTQIGLVAISNNLPTLIDDFTRFRRQLDATSNSSVSAGTALRKFAAGFIGSGGLTILIGAAATAIPILISRFIQAGEKAKKAADDIKSLSDVLNTAAGSGLGQEAQIRALINVFGDVTKSTRERKRALEELREVNRAYFGDLEFEKTSIAELTKRQNELNQAIIQEAIIKGAKAEIEKLGPAYAKAAKELKEASRQSFDVSQLKEGEQAIDAAGNRIFRFNEGAAEASNRLKTAQSNFNAINKQVQEFIGLINDATASLVGFKDTKTVPKTQVKVDKLEYVPNKISIVGLDQKTIDDAVNEQFRIDSGAGVNVPLNLTIPQAAFDALKKFGENEYWKKIQENTQGIINQFDQFLAPVINTAFEALGNGTNVIKAIGQSLKALVVQIGITIARAAILSAILNSIFPGGAAIGGKTVSGFGNIFKSILGFGQTASPNFGGVTGGGLAVNVGGSFNIRGTDLVAVVQQSNQRIGRTG